MNKPSVEWLYRELPDLVNQGVITQTTSDKIHAHYGVLNTIGGKRFAVILCSIIGTILVGLGVALLFAHNWAQLSRPLRVCLSLFPLIIGQTLALLVLLKRHASYVLKESTATFTALMVGASIALISQTYNIHGNLADFILSWMLLIAPLTYLMESSITALIYVIGLVARASYCFGMDEPTQALVFWPLFTVMVPHFIWLLYQDKYKFREIILFVALAIAAGWGSIQMSVIFNDHLWTRSWIMIDSAFVTLMYFLGIWRFKNISINWQKFSRWLGTFGIFVMTLLLSFRFPWVTMGKSLLVTNWDFSLILVLDYALGLLLVGIAVFMFLRYIKQKELIGTLFGATVVLALMGSIFGEKFPVVPQVLFNALLFILSISQMTVGIRTNSLRTVNTGTLMLAALITARFFDTEVSFLVKGFVFITIGIWFLVTNMIIVRRKQGAS